VIARKIIGLTSGSNADGVEAALVDSTGAGMELRFLSVLTLHQPYTRDLRELIRRVCSSSQADLKQIGLLHRLLGEAFAAAARQVADRASLTLQSVHCIGCAGHTVWHEPEGRFPSTLSLGMAPIVAERTGVTTVSDFRTRDLAMGGQGVPLAALPDYLLFSHASETRVLIHLGGLARIVYLPAGGRPQEVVGFEVGPCNLLLDGLMRRLSSGKEEFDPGGRHGVQGRCHERLLQQWLAHPYLNRRPPKCVPRQAYLEEFIGQALHFGQTTEASLHDLLCTATHFVSRSVAGSVQRFLPSEPRIQRVILSGGGVRNGLLWHSLQQQLAHFELFRSDHVGIPSDGRNALGAGILAALTVDGVPANLPGATGASGSRLLGSITPGSSANWARCLNWMGALAGFSATSAA
jgi:anhydro-N-acetylmuramic acid kinase